MPSDRQKSRTEEPAQNTSIYSRYPAMFISPCPGIMIRYVLTECTTQVYAVAITHLKEIAPIRPQQGLCLGNQYRTRRSSESRQPSSSLVVLRHVFTLMSVLSFHQISRNAPLFQALSQLREAICLWQLHVGNGVKLLLLLILRTRSRASITSRCVETSQASFF